MKKQVLVFCILATPLLMILARGNLFPFPFGSPYSDLTITHIPNLEFIRDSLIKYHQIPLWNPHLFAGYPFSANPLSSIWYLPFWLALAIPNPLGMNLLAALHMFWGAIGVYYFLEDIGLSDYSCLLGALLWEMLPKIFSHYAMGHITLVFAVSWTGWLLLATKRGLEQNSSPKRMVFPGIILGMILLADVRWIAVAGIFWVAYIMYLLVTSDHKGDSRLHLLIGYVVKTGGWIAVGLMIASPLLLPFAQFVNQSTRSGLSSQDSTMMSLAPARVFGFLVPDMAGVGEWMLYCGGLLLPLLAWGLWSGGFKKERLFFGSMALFGLLISMGENIPGVSSLFRLPGLNLLRVPSRFLFIVGFCFVMIMAMTIELIFNRVTRSKGQVVGGRLSVVLIMVFIAFICLGLFILTGKLPFEFLWSSIIVIPGAFLILLFDYQVISPVIMRFSIICLFLVDLCVVNGTQVSYIPRNNLEDSELNLLKDLPSDGEPFRIYSPSYELGQYSPLVNGSYMASGVDPLQLKAYVKFLQSAGNFNIKGYDVTLPPLAQDDIHSSNKNSIPDPHLLGLLNVKYILTGYPYDIPDLQLIHVIHQTYEYKNKLVRSAAWIEENGSSNGYIPVKIDLYSPNKVVLTTRGYGRLVLADQYYPGWTVSINGHPAKIIEQYGILRSVNLLGGDQSIVFIYRPMLQYIGLIIACVAWSIIFIVMVKI